MKTSITLDEKTLNQLEEYRRRQKQIPTRSKAIVDLILKQLKEYDIPKPKRITEPKQPSDISVIEDKKTIPQ
jgi:metal-responsive CopG/Arc/MetJ family transcriptional regulator